MGDSKSTPTSVGGLVVPSTFYVASPRIASVGQTGGTLSLSCYVSDSLSILMEGTLSSDYDIGYFTAMLAAGGGGFNTGFTDAFTHSPATLRLSTATACTPPPKSST